MKKIILSAVLALLTVPAFTSAATTYYVDTAATGTPDGLSRETAFTSIPAAIAVALDEDIINIASGTYEMTSQLSLTKAISLIGEGNVTLKAVADFGTVNGSKHLFAIFAGSEAIPVTISNITFDCDGKCYGVNTYNNAYGVLDNVIITNSKGAGLTVNGSTIVANNLNTSGNSWGSVNVDPGSGSDVVTPSAFILNSGSLSENTQIWSDGRNVTGTKTVVVNAPTFTKYSVAGNSQAFRWAEGSMVASAVITKNEIPTIYESISSAISSAESGDTIVLHADATTTSQITINKAVTFDGNGHTISANFQKTSATDYSNNSAIGVGHSDVTIKNVTLDGSSGGQVYPLQLHGINVYQSIGVNLNDVTISNFGGSGVVVNGSEVTATNLNTSGNGWNGVNVDPGSGVAVPSVFTLNSGTLGENKQIWSDGKYVTETASVTVTSPEYVKYPVNSTYPAASLWANKDVIGFASITRDSITKLYTSIQSAIDAADSGEMVNVASGTYNENLVVNKNVTLRGPNAGVDSQATRGAEAVINGMVQLSDGPEVAVTFDGFTVNGPAGDARAIAPGASVGSKVLNNIINVSKRSVQGDYYGRPSDLTIRGNEFNTEYGIAGTEDVSGLVVENNVFNTSAEGVGVGEGAVITSLSGNKFLGAGVYDWRTVGTSTIVASKNWWGVANPDFSTLVSGNVATSPWYADEAMTTLSSEVTETASAKSTVFSAETAYSSDTVNMVIPEGTTITGPLTWDGVFNLPEITTTYTIPSESNGFWYKPTLAIEMGAEGAALTFDKPVKLTFTGQAGKSAGWSQNGTFHKISSTCTSATAPTLEAGADCKIDVGSDLLVWTRHATAFIAFAEEAIPYGGGGGNSASSVVVPTTPASQVAQTAVANTPNTTGQVLGTTISEQASGKSQGKVLGASTASFARDMSVGMRGEDIGELQKMLIAEGLLSGEATNYFGSLTKAALAQWQKDNGLPATGYFGSMTRSVLSEKETKKPAVRGVNTFNFSKNLRFGLKGTEVTELQKVLMAQGYLKITTATDYFGPMTKSALVQWQKDNNLPATGYFGPMSREVMLR